MFKGKFEMNEDLMGGGGGRKSTMTTNTTASLSPSMSAQLSRSSSKSSITGSTGTGAYPNEDESNTEKSTEKLLKSNPWVPPNDRELIIRAKLKTGWSSRSSSASNTKENRAKGNNAMTMMMGNNINTSGNYINTNNSRNFMQQQASNALADSQSPKNSFNYQPQISDAEFYEIEQVLKRASAIEQKEYDRIGRLYQRYNLMNKPQGNGETSCFICNSNFGILGASPRICNDCLKNVCSTCSIDSLSMNKQSTIWLCRICAEYRDFLKKSGAWFNKRVPLTATNGSTSTGITPSNSNLSSNNSNSIRSDEIKPTTMLTQIQKSPTKQDMTRNSNKKELTSVNNSVNMNNNKNQHHHQQQQQQTDSEDEDGLKNPFVDIKSKHSSISLNKSDLEDESNISVHSSAAVHPTGSNPNNNQLDINQHAPHDTSAASVTSATSVVSALSSIPDNTNDPAQLIDANNNTTSAKLDDKPLGKCPQSLLTNPSLFHSSKMNQILDPHGKSNIHGKINESPSSSAAAAANNNVIFFDPILESKLIQDQIANSKPMQLANSTAISASANTSAYYNNHNLANTSGGSGSNVSASGTHNDRNFKKTSTLSHDSLSNLSLAFQSYKPARPSNSKLGYLQFTVEYIPSLLQLKIELISATDLPARDSNGFSDPYVKIHLLPGIAKATKLRSKTIYKNLNPQFNESFHYDGVTTQDLDTKTLRLTVLDEDKFGFDFIGEYRLPLKTLILNEVNHFNVALEEKLQNDDESDLSIRGKINFALKYSKQSNCLFVKINRCTQLLPMDNGKSSDPFVQVSLLPFSKENKQKFKTSVKRKTLDPEFFEEFKFTNVDLRSLLTKTIEIAVWDKDFRKNDFIGLVQLGQDRTGDELKHFFTMIKNPELYHEQWHTLHLKSIGASVDSL